MTHAITFVVPAFNAARTVPDTLRSLCSQTRLDWNAIVIDDGSGDGTEEAVKPFLTDARTQYIRQANSGVAAARNRGLSLARSPAVCFLDADDTIDPMFAERMLEALKGHDLVAASHRYAGPDLADVAWVAQITTADVQRLTEVNNFALGAVVFDREALIRRAGDRPFRSGSSVEDWELLVSLMGARWGTPLAEPLYTYRLSPRSRNTDLCAVWRDGLNLIAARFADPRMKAQALRRWTVRNLARGAVAADRHFCSCLFEHLDRLTAFDTDALAGALRWSIRRASASREPLSLQTPELWQSQMLTALGHSEIALEALRRAARPDWAIVAAAAAARVRPGQTLVLYGLGRNGRDLLSALEPKGVSLAVIDDGPAAPANLPRLSITDLTPKHIVLVTPDDRSSILVTLRQGKQAQVLLPEQLVA